MNFVALPTCTIDAIRVVALGASAEGSLQRFFEANPEYFLSVTGRPAQPGDARDELHETLPDGWQYAAISILGWAKPSGELVAMANVVSDLFAPGIWHLNTFIVETARHGNGDAHSIYRDIERWAIAGGATWLRLGVVLGSTRAERFWERQGYLQTRLRHGVEMGGRVNTLRVMCKPLAQGSLAQYLQLVARDRPEPENAAQADGGRRRADDSRLGV